MQKVLAAGFALALIAASARCEESGKAAKSAAAPPADANLFIFRDVLLPLIMPTTLKVDGVTVASFGNHHFTALHVEPGKHEIKMSWPLLATTPGGKLWVTVEADGPSYVQLTGGMGASGGGRDTLVGSQSDSLAVRPADDAAAFMAKCCTFVAPK